MHFALLHCTFCTFTVVTLRKQRKNEGNGKLKVKKKSEFSNNVKLPLENSVKTKDIGKKKTNILK